MLKKPINGQPAPLKKRIVWRKLKDDGFIKWDDEQIGVEHCFAKYLGATPKGADGLGGKHSFETEDGAVIGARMTTVLDKWLHQATIGQPVRIVYLGEEVSKKPGRKAYKNFDVELGDIEEGEPA